MGEGGRCLSLSITVGGGIKQVSSKYKLKSKLRVTAKCQANYVSLVIFICKTRNAAEQNMTTSFVGDIGCYFMLDYICQNCV